MSEPPKLPDIAAAMKWERARRIKAEIERLRSPAPAEQTKLEPCPFCGSTHIEVEQEPERCWRVRCIHCWALSPTDTNEADAIAAWNRRSPAPAEDGGGWNEAIEAAAKVADDWGYHRPEPNIATAILALSRGRDGGKT